MEPHGFTVFCDDVREELHGKTSLIGCYGNDLQFVGKYPLILPKLAFQIFARFPVDRPTPELALCVFFPGDSDDKPTIEGPLPPIPPEMQDAKPPTNPPKKITDFEPSHLLRFHFGISPARINSDGYIKVRLKYGTEIIRLGTLQIVCLGESAAAPARP